MPPPMPTRSVPTPRSRAGKTFARAIYDFAADAPDRLSFSEGELLEVTEQSDDGWWSGFKNDRWEENESAI